MRAFLPFAILLGTVLGVSAATSIDAVNKFGYGANIGWMSWRGDTNNGAVIGEFVCSGFLFSANVGWIHLGNNSPTNGVQYQNKSTNDFGINHDGLGNLRGFAYGANIGWINFESNGAPKVDLKTGSLSGSIYSANCGWISLSNASAVVQTDVIARGTDSNGNGLPDAWERIYFGGLGVNPNADPDGDGMSNREEYLAGTNPTNSADALVITGFDITPDRVTLTWNSVATRCYRIETARDAANGGWVDSGLGTFSSTGTSTTRSLSLSGGPSRFLRVEAVRPLIP